MFWKRKKKEENEVEIPNIKDELYSIREEINRDTRNFEYPQTLGEPEIRVPHEEKIASEINEEKKNEKDILMEKIDLILMKLDIISERLKILEEKIKERGF